MSEFDRNNVIETISDFSEQRDIIIFFFTFLTCDTDLIIVLCNSSRFL